PHLHHTVSRRENFRRNPKRLPPADRLDLHPFAVRLLREGFPAAPDLPRDFALSALTPVGRAEAWNTFLRGFPSRRRTGDHLSGILDLFLK
ncbi:MAG: hypothetical protein LLG43_01515, partial [Deltaproteobacteria bacterium]|nr:hypothetical protein [Deltaproteobacteria bacterium]